MNRVFSTVWNHSLGAWVVTSEHATRQGKRGARRLARVLTLTALGLGAPLLALAADLPTGGQVVLGSGQIGTSANQMVINQSSNKLAINWQTFDIAAGNKVTFNQPGKDAVALNRVLGADGSKIMGQLDANGRVFIVNPNGVVFGQGASVNVGGLVASTLAISDADFAAGNYQFKGDGTNKAVVNQGAITATDGGAVALLGGTVSNQGVIVANQGTVALAAGNKVTLDFAGDGLLNVQVDEAVVDALAENHQLIKADGGQVLLTAHAGDALLKTVVNNTGVIEARTLGEKDGKIVLLGSFDGGSVQVAGTLDASAPNGGNGGFIDTSGAHVKIADTAKVTTKAANGKTGTWLIDPTDFTISAGGAAQTSSGIGADTLSSNLASSNVTLQTVDAGSDAGDIHVNADVSYSQNTLTLNAHRTININAVISVNGSATLALNYGNTKGNSATTAAPGSTLNVSGGRVDFAQVGTGLLAVNGHAYTVINSLSALQGIDGNLSGNYALGNNIDASATAGWNGGLGFNPIGNLSTSYTGIFDGLGHSISGLTIDRPTQSMVGLFGVLGSTGTLRNIGLLGGAVSGSYYVGGLVGYNGGTISNAYATGAVTGTGSSVGGLVGYNDEYGTISNAYATGTVTGNNFVGGLVGYNNSGGSIRNAYATGTVTGSSSVGGLVGSNGGGSITASFYATTDAHGDPINNSGASTGGTAKTWDELTELSTFADWGTDIDAQGGTGSVWRIYEGQTGPLLRSFLKAVTVTVDPAITGKTYDGNVANGTFTYTPSLAGAPLDGSATYTSSSANAGTYTAADGTLRMGLYSSQQGYDISYTSSSLTIDKAALTVTANNASKTYDGLAYNGSAGVSYSGFVNGENTSVLDGNLTYASGIEAGTHAIDTSGLSSGNYAISYAHGTLTVSAAAPKPTPTPTPPDVPSPPPAASPVMTSPLAPGLYVQVIDGMILLSNPSGSANFRPGQFGYSTTATPVPVVLPTNPGLSFSPPPAFSSLASAPQFAGLSIVGSGIRLPTGI